MINTIDFKPGILVPITNEPGVHTNTSFEQTMRFDYLHVDNTLFAHLIKAGVFETINRSGNIMIDEYEEEVLLPERMPDVMKVLLFFKTKGIQYDFVVEFVDTLLDMLKTAHQNNRPMFFIF